MHNNKNSQKGVSLIIIFFILTIILAVVLSISVILQSQIKIIRNIGDSVTAFYAADSGMEGALYYDRWVIPTNNPDPEGLPATRGLCYICDSSPFSNCQVTPKSIETCDPFDCENCEVSFDSVFDGKSYELFIDTNTDPLDGSVDTTFDSKGLYKDVSRKIRLQVESP